MRSIAPIRTAKIGYIIISLIFCILGTLLIVRPRFSISILGMICGIVLIVFGIIKIIGYFSKDLFRLAFQYDLFSGILLIVLGILMLVKPGSLMNLLCVTLGLFILADALAKMKISIESKRFGIKTWWLIITLAGISALCGLLLVFRPSESVKVLTTILGITLLFEGILNLCTVLISVKIIKHQQPDIIDADYYIEREE